MVLPAFSAQVTIQNQVDDQIGKRWFAGFNFFQLKLVLCMSVASMSQILSDSSYPASQPAAVTFPAQNMTF